MSEIPDCSKVSGALQVSLGACVSRLCYDRPSRGTLFSSIPGYHEGRWAVWCSMPFTCQVEPPLSASFEFTQGNYQTLSAAVCKFLTSGSTLRIRRCAGVHLLYLMDFLIAGSSISIQPTCRSRVKTLLNHCQLCERKKGFLLSTWKR